MAKIFHKQIEGSFQNSKQQTEAIKQEEIIKNKEPSKVSQPISIQDKQELTPTAEHTDQCSVTFLVLVELQ